ncbi:hypothetical protein BDN71DRAFT_1514329 [Pleurotus eryngii]|uniref:Uncharacterized protein n=1 Tax=Pleurotus eryngii TaxID=5323 RepID=A0A9P5ZGL6_PLEER|nr:hypothetical protein BDN71DRAFT_1514329 [Pleurotus eryngii]
MPANAHQCLANSLLKPRSTRSATAAAKAQQEANEEEPVEPVKTPRASAVKKIKKDKRTSTVRDAEDKAAAVTAAKKLTLTAKLLKESGAGVALPPRSAGTGVQLGSATPRIVSDRARRPKSDDEEYSADEEDPDDDAVAKDGDDSGDKEEPAPVVDKGKGKARDLHNLGAESDKELDVDVEEEKDDEDADEDANEDANEKDVDSENMGTGDDSELAAVGEDTAMDEDLMVTPRKPAATPRKSTTSKRNPSQSPVGHRHAAKAQRCTSTHTSASSAPEGSPSPLSDHLEDLQGALRTTGGFAHGKAFGTALNMADFVRHDDIPIFQSHSSGKVILYSTLTRTDTPHSATIPRFPTLAPILKAISRKYPTVTTSLISIWDGESWEVVGPYLLALEEDGDVSWPDNFKLALLLKPAASSSNVFFAPSLGSSHSGGSVPPSGSSMAPSSIAPSASISFVGVSNAGGLPPAPAYLTAAYLAKPNLIPFTQLLEVPPSLVSNTKPNVTLISAFDHWCATSDAPDCLRAVYNVYNTKVPRLPPLPAFPSVKDARAVYVNTTSFSNYSKLFPFAIQHPAVLSYLQGDVPSGSAEYAALWGALKPGLKTLGIVMKKLMDEKEKEEKKAKKKAGLSKLK